MNAAKPIWFFVWRLGFLGAAAGLATGAVYGATMLVLGMVVGALTSERSR